MNEAANFCDGHCEMNLENVKEWEYEEFQFECQCNAPILSTPPTSSNQLLTNLTELFNTTTGLYDYSNYYSTYDFPPYKVGGINPDVSTLSMASVHYNNSYEYEVHNLYGHLQGKASTKVMEEITKKRGFVLSRSTIASSGHFMAHWLGDNVSSWVDMIYSVPGVLAMNLFGIPMVGADICGFNYNVSAELCARWVQLGALGYTLVRNHNTYVTIPQEPYSFGPSVLDISQSVLYLRYSLLPYYYTLFFDTSMRGGTVLSPLFLEYPSDPNCRSIDDQLMIGSALLFAPVLEEGQLERRVYFPASHWFDFFSGELISSSSSQFINIEIISIKQILLYIKGGSIVPLQPFTSPELSTRPLTSALARRNPFNLLIALTPSNQSLDLPDQDYYYYYNYYEDNLGSSSDYLTASGEMYFDDGISLNSPFSHWTFSAIFYWEYNYGIVDISIDKFDYKNYDPEEVYWKNVTMYGVSSYPNLVMLNNTLQISTFIYDRKLKALTIYDLNQPLSDSFTIYWGYNPPDQSPVEKFLIILSGILITVSILTFFTIIYYYCTRKLESFFFFKKFNHLVSDFEGGAGEVSFEMDTFSPPPAPEFHVDDKNCDGTLNFE